MGSMGYKVPSGEYAHPLISERAIDEPRPLKVIYVGAGVSGILAAIRFPQSVPTVELAIYEKNADVGGTWFENRYPGCACDIPAHSYQLSFESSTDWSQFYAGAPEILKYWQRIVEKYNLRKYMKFQHKCIEARWNEESSKWQVKFQRTDTGEVVEDTGDVLMLGTGVLNEWKWPAIQGLHDFKGAILHSANWDETFDAKVRREAQVPTDADELQDKKIAVIGAGSSGIQIVPALQPKVKAMDHYIRGRTWIAATFAADAVKARNDGKDGNFTYTEEEKTLWRENPKAYLEYRRALEIGMQGCYALAYQGTPEHEGARAAFNADMRNRLAKKQEIIDHLLPDFPPICKRLTPGPGYLEALTADNVDVIADPISHIDATGIVTKDGNHRPVDAIVCATGFDTSFQGRFPIYGRGGVNLQTRYQTRPETYLSMCTDGFPNFFQSLGPNAGVGNGNLLIIAEAISLYVGQVLQKLATGNVKEIEPKRKQVENFTNYCDAYFKRTVFSAECNSWYKSSPPGATAEERKRGRVTAIWPGSSTHAVRALQHVRWEDYEITKFDDNDFGWFGDGWAEAERTGDTQGLSYYLNNTKFIHEPLGKEDTLLVDGEEMVIVKNANGHPITNGEEKLAVKL